MSVYQASNMIRRETRKRTLLAIFYDLGTNVRIWNGKFLHSSLPDPCKRSLVERFQTSCRHLSIVQVRTALLMKTKTPWLSLNLIEEIAKTYHYKSEFHHFGGCNEFFENSCYDLQRTFFICFCHDNFTFFSRFYSREAWNYFLDSLKWTDLPVEVPIIPIIPQVSK